MASKFLEEFLKQKQASGESLESLDDQFSEDVLGLQKPIEPQNASTIDDMSVLLPKPSAPVAKLAGGGTKSMPTAPAPSQESQVKTDTASPEAAIASKAPELGLSGTDWDAELADAQDRQRRANQTAGIFGALSSGIARMSGKEAPQGMFDNLTKQGAAEVEGVKARRELLSKQLQDRLSEQKVQSGDLELKTAQSAQDPASPENQMFRQFVAKKMPEAANSPGFEKMTVASPALKWISDFWSKSEDRKLAMAQAAATRDLANATREKEAAARQGRFEDDRIKDYSNAADKSGIPEISDSLVRINNIVKKAGKGDIPGYGATGWVWGGVLSEDGQTLRNEISNLRDMIGKARSGGQITDNEATRLYESLGVGSSRTDEQLRKGLDTAIKLMQSKMSNLQARIDPSLLEVYKKRGGTATLDNFNERIGSKPAPQTASQTSQGTVRVKNKETGQIGSMPAANLEKALKSGKYEQVN